jgi:hypothetical protein
MRALSESLNLFMPPRWLAWVAAVLAACALLMAFVSTLHEGVKRGHALREQQRSGPVRHVVGVIATAAPAPAAPQSGSSDSPTSPR